MTPAHHQIHNWMTAAHRTARFTPVTKLNTFERIDSLEFLLRSVWAFSRRVGVDLGQMPVGITHAAKDSVIPAEILESLVPVYANVLALAQTYGLDAALNGALYEFTNRENTPGAGPGHHEPNYQHVLDLVYPPTT